MKTINEQENAKRALIAARISSAHAQALAEEHAGLNNGLNMMMRPAQNEQDVAQAWVGYMKHAILDPVDRRQAERDLVDYIRTAIPHLLNMEQSCQGAALSS